MDSNWFFKIFRVKGTKDIMRGPKLGVSKIQTRRDIARLNTIGFHVILEGIVLQPFFQICQFVMAEILK